jgi:hypothetical protein
MAALRLHNLTMQARFVGGPLDDGQVHDVPDGYRLYEAVETLPPEAAYTTNPPRALVTIHEKRYLYERLRGRQSDGTVVFVCAAGHTPRDDLMGGAN